MLFDSKQIFEDQLEAVEEASRKRGNDYVVLALLTDGLRAEREQGITIDVAYRYFATPKRKFVLADTPGHVQYTRNMVTGSSTANIALILVDARNGVLEQTKRHSFLASLLGVPHMVLCVNKMDLVDWSEDRYNEVVDEFREFAMRLDIPDLRFVPISALEGDNVVNPSENMAWYRGPTILNLLEEIHIGSDQNMIDVDEVTVLPSGFSTRIKSIDTYDGPLEEATPPMSVLLTLDDHIDVSRGDMICRPHNQPHASQDLDAMVCWMSGGPPLREGAQYAIKHTTRWGRAMIKDLQYRFDVNTLHRDDASEGLGLNEIGRVRIRTTTPLFFDEYRRNRTTGSFILVDEGTNVTVGAGMITGEAS